jgi:3-hydroxyisobutyrate dehydrogenase-like beta-hydroxyacid dehydrogenase
MTDPMLGRNLLEEVMSLIVAVVGAGNMGAAVARRLTEHGVEVLTTLAGRGAASVARAAAAGMVDVPFDGLTRAQIVLSILPPAQALGFAERMASVLAARAAGAPTSARSARSAEHEPVFVDCNAVSPETVRGIGAVVAGAGVSFVDGSIIGLPPRTGQVGPRLYVSGEPEGVARVRVLAERGLDVRVLDGPVGAASALKMSFAGINKGVAAIASAMILAAARAGTAEALYEEMSESLPGLLESLRRQVPDMLPKAYRWVAEMREIAAFAGEDAAARQVYEGFAELFDRVARDVAGEKRESSALTGFFAGRN